MRKINLIAAMAFSVILLSNCKKEDEKPAANDGNKTGNTAIEVVQKNTSIFGKLTATWCGPCGSWGWTLNDELIAQLGSDAISMGLYGSNSSNFTNATVTQWNTDFGGKSFPNFIANGTNKTDFPTPTTINPAQTKTNVLDAVSAHKNAEVEINAGGKFSWDNQILKVKAAVKSFKALTGEYYIGAYMVEDKAKSVQAGRTGTLDHHHVCRGTMSENNIYGVKYNGALTAGTQTSIDDFTFDVPATWVKENMYVAIIIWKKVGTKYTFVNASKLGK